MRTQFVQGDRTDAENECPWASVILGVIGGFMCFESVDDYKVWAGQK